MRLSIISGGKDKEEFHRQFSGKKGLTITLNKQLYYIAILGLFCNGIAWATWLRPSFEDKSGSFLWFVIYPYIAQMVCCVLITFLYQIFNKILKKDDPSRNACFRILCSFFYTFYFTSMIYFYRDISAFWLFAICPMLLTSFYRNFIWMFSTLFLIMTEIIALCFDIFKTDRYVIYSPNPWMTSSETIIIGLIVAAFALVLHYQIEMSIEEASKVKATQDAKTAFFAKMSHEIRTPINAVLGMDEMILREEISPEVEEYACNIRNAGQSLLSIINDILDASKLEAGRLELIPAKYDLMSIITDCYNMISLRAKDKGLDLKVSNDPSVPKYLYGDEVRIRQIITNLLTNGVKYTKVGYVELSISWQKLEGDNMNLIISVKDTGMGISDEDKEKLFESFQRLNEQKNKYVEGTGLGLSITKQLIDMMGGSVSVESVIDEGSTFTVTIPQKIMGMSSLGDFYKSVSARTRVVEKYQEKFQAPDAKVLVVDDVLMNLDVFKGLLKKTLIQIDTALSGERALELAKQKKYDIIFMDHLMPEMDGVETLKRLKEMDTKNNETPVVALTANAGNGAEEEYKSLGFTDYLSKPVKGKYLEEMVLKYLNAARETKENERFASQAAAVLNEDDCARILSRLTFIDTVMGMSCCANDVKLYRDIIEDYVTDSRLELLNTLFEKQDWIEYRTQIHALKSTSLSIGAIELSEEAKHLEVCAAELNFEEIKNHHADTMKHYEEMLTKLRGALS